MWEIDLHSIISVIQQYSLSMERLKSIFRNNVPSYIFPILVYIYSIYFADKKGFQVSKQGRYIDIKQRKKCIRLSINHINYFQDIIHSFKYYFHAVKPLEIDGIELVDYSTPRFHEVMGYDLHPIIFPSFAEPLSTTDQYIKFANLKKGDIVLDLGAYSGLTSIRFGQQVGKKGEVIAVDADYQNVQYLKKNLYYYFRMTGKKIQLLEGAVWEHNDGLMFSSEGNMGSSAVSFVGTRNDHIVKVPSYTLSKIVQKFKLLKVDFIKCDIEGGESVIFKDKAFFEKFRPRIIIETHEINGQDTESQCRKYLSKCNYRFKKVVQKGVSLPLLECSPE